MSHQNNGRGVTGEEFQRIKNDRIVKRRTITRKRRRHHFIMKSTSGIHPLERFPKEIWEQILEPLSPKDLGKIWKVHPLFQEILENRYIRDILFPQIVNLKFPPFWKPERSPEPLVRYGIMYSDRFRISRRPVAPLALAKFTKLREVSKSLRNGIDQWYENEIIRNLRSETEVKVATHTCAFAIDRGGVLELSGLEILDSFSGDGNKAKRFFLRSLKIKLGLSDSFWTTCNRLEEFSQFKYKITSLLELIGEQIWRFEYDIMRMAYLERVCGIPSSQMYLALKEWADLMPNLKWLVLRNKGEIGMYIASMLAQSRFHATISPNIYEDTPFPHLKNLSRIGFHLDSKMYANIFPIFSAVLKANQHVKVLNVDPGKDEETNGSFYTDHLSPLMESLSLSLEMFSVNHVLSDLGVQGNVQPMINFNWPLKHIHLRWDAFNSTMKSVLGLLNNFPSLENVTLSLVNVWFEDDIPFLELPNLTQLKFEVKYKDQYIMAFTPATNFFFSLQFLLHARKLKKLDWKLEVWESAMRKLRRFLVNRECYGERVNFRGGMRNLRSSNLWDCFPDLQRVKVKLQKDRKNGDVTVCRREDRF